MLVEIIDSSIGGVISISDKAKEDEFLTKNSAYIRTNFIFVEAFDLYKYDGATFNLIAGWELIKSKRLEDARIASLPPVVTFEELQAKMIKELHINYDKEFQAYLDQYPVAEQKSFITKAQEASAYMSDNTAPTPYVSGLVGGNETLRVELLTAIWAKVEWSALSEGNMIRVRDAIKACTTIKELEALAI